MCPSTKKRKSVELSQRKDEMLESDEGRTSGTWSKGVGEQSHHRCRPRLATSWPRSKAKNENKRSLTIPQENLDYPASDHANKFGSGRMPASIGRFWMALAFLLASSWAQ